MGGLEEQLGGTTEDVAAVEIVTEKRITLDKPITVGVVLYEYLDLCEPLADELEQASLLRGEIAQLMKLIQLNAKVPMAVVKKLPQRKLMECGAFFGTFSTATKD